MSKFFDELMESVKQADEIFRREHGDLNSKPAPKMPLKIEEHLHNAPCADNDQDK
ncbi:hypothetical protein ACTJK3_17790 [Pseudomonas sp. 22105]|uniref:hypothetical protein n=1 Tax=Pseudomonas TaxID=286 RepID=UPI00131F1355|nr:hypothetical protein [Pseudomonas glycinae]